MPEKTRHLFNALDNRQDVFCALSQGARETTFIVSAEVKDHIKKIFQNETKVSEISNLSSVTIRLPKEVVYILGVYYQILKRLAFENINVIEILSTYTEITVIIDTRDVEKAFSVLKKIS
ncbi:hypothetical protein HYS95_02025 [Candidatus Daviesbacteria bacterium]|nr:hypothetical protein [Candidatus Daviesbacteria bacterium]